MEMTNDEGEKLSFGEVTKVLAAQWKALGTDDRVKYDNMKLKLEEANK